MNKVLMIVSVLALLSVSLSSIPVAGTRHEMESYSAGIYAIDMESKSLTLENCFTGDYCVYTTIFITEDTKFLSDQTTDPITFADLEVGWWISVKYYEVGTTKYAWIIRIKFL